jgi:type II restriction enzyme
LTARRAGWIGCNILLGNIPPEGRIPLIVDGKQIPKRQSRASFAAADQLSSLSATTRGWAGATLSLLHKMGKEEFSIEDAYSLEPGLGRLFPNNQHVKAKIRQQLQVLRDAGMITFKSRGNYQFTKYLREN